MTYLFNGLQLLGLGLLLALWLLRATKSNLLKLTAQQWQKAETLLVALIIVFSCIDALISGIKPWLEMWYAEQLIALMAGTILMRISMKYYQRMWVRIIIWLGVCGWLIIAAKAGIHHQPIGLS